MEEQLEKVLGGGSNYEQFKKFQKQLIEYLMIAKIRDHSIPCIAQSNFVIS